jgi:hypothetical protein
VIRPVYPESKYQKQGGAVFFSAASGRSGRAPAVVLIVVLAIVAGVAVMVSRVGRGGVDETPVVAETSQPEIDSAGAARPAPEDSPPVVRALTQLEQLIEEGKTEALAIGELGPDATASEMRNVEQEWHAWRQEFGERLDQVSAQLPEPPGEEAERELKLGYGRIVSALDQLRRLTTPESNQGVPRKLVRESVFGIAENHVESARTYFYRIGL